MRTSNPTKFVRISVSDTHNGFIFGRGSDYFLFANKSRPSLGPTQAPVQRATAVQVIIHLHLVLRLRKSGAILPLSQMFGVVLN
jgi:hypothetical protein